jgi:alpha-galactosidase
VRNTLTRAWMHPALWLNDPDCLLVREHDSDLTHDEVLAFASAVGLTGGQVMLSDRLSQLTLERIGIVSRLIPPMRERALPASVFGYGIPERVAVPIVRPWGQWLLLGLFNGEDDERYVSVRWSDHGLPRGEYHAVEFWSDTYLGRSALGVTVRVAPHGAAVLAVRADTREPQLLSTSFHISQGAVEIEDWQYDSPRREIRWRARIGRQALGTFTLWLPPGLLPVRLESSAASATWTRGTAGDIRIMAEIREEASFVLELESDA